MDADSKPEKVANRLSIVNSIKTLFDNPKCTKIQKGNTKENIEETKQAKSLCLWEVLLNFEKLESDALSNIQNSSWQTIMMSK